MTQQTRNLHHCVLAQGCPSLGRGSRGSSCNPGSPVKIGWWAWWAHSPLKSWLQRGCWWDNGISSRTNESAVERSSVCLLVSKSRTGVAFDRHGVTVAGEGGSEKRSKHRSWNLKSLAAASGWESSGKQLWKLKGSMLRRWKVRGLEVLPRQWIVHHRANLLLVASGWLLNLQMRLELDNTESEINRRRHIGCCLPDREVSAVQSKNSLTPQTAYL